MLGESDTVEIETEASPAAVGEILKNVPGIAQIVIKETSDGVTRAQIREKKGEDARGRIFDAFAGNRVTLLTLRRLSVSLEDVFMELTQKETVPEAFRRKMQETAFEETAGAEPESAQDSARNQEKDREGDEIDDSSL